MDKSLWIYTRDPTGVSIAHGRRGWKKMTHFLFYPSAVRSTSGLHLEAKPLEGATQAEGKRNPKQIVLRFFPQPFWVIILPGSLGRDMGDPSQKSVMWLFRTIKHNYDCVNCVVSCV